MSTALSLPTDLTVDAFLAWNAPMGSHWQLVDGTPQAMDPDRAWPERPQVVKDGDLTLLSIGYTGPLAALYRNTWLHQA